MKVTPVAATAMRITIALERKTEERIRLKRDNGTVNKPIDRF